MALDIDIYTESISKFGEDLCGNKAEIIRNQSGVTVVFADGPGSGVKASMLSSLIIKMCVSMLSRGESVKDAVETVVGTQVSGTGDLCSAFTIIQISDSGLAQISEVDMPPAVLLRKGKITEIDMTERVNGRSRIREGRLPLKAGDILTVFNNGIISSGEGSALEAGWGREMAAAYLQAAYKPEITAERLTKLLLAAGSSLDLDKPRDDLTVLTLCVEQGKF